MYGRPPPSSWQTNPNNPNMAPIPSGPRGAGVGPPPGPPPPMGPGGPYGGGSPHDPNGSLPHRSGPPPGYGSAPLPGPGGPSGTGSNSIPSAQVDPSTTIFVGSITPGVSDMMLKQLLGFCGTLVNLKRISPAFGFASFDHPEAVIRAIDLLNGLALPPPGVTDNFDKQEKTKKLNVKADEKTRAFVEEYKANRSSRATAEDELDNAGKAQIDNFVKQLAAPDALSHFADAASANATLVPAHLKDLPPEDVPEEHRTSVLGEIDKFRQASAAREEEKRMRERVLERERMQQAHMAGGSGPGRPTGPRLGGPPTGPNGAAGVNPQSFNHGAPNFVQSRADAGAKSLEDMDPEEADEVEHQRRKELAAKDDERRTAEALSAYTNRERQRLAHWTRILEDSKLEDSRREKLRSQLLHRSEEWDEDLERSRELFWLDRPRWRHYRNPMLRREQDEDAADARAEEEEARKAQLEAEKFLARQEEEMRKHLEEQRKAGVLVDGSNMQPLKLKIGAGAGANKDGTAPALTAPAGGAVLGGDDEDEESKARRGAAIKVDLGDGMTPEERTAAVQAKRREVLAALSDLSREDLFGVPVKWDWVDEASIAEVYQRRVEEAVTEAIGEPVPELVDVVVGMIRSHKGAEAIQQAVEPVMAEDAPEFTESIWRLLVEESTVASSGLLA
ncbi:hypothetical protein BCV69DRAFT_310784 [Microstroma glucosiphilum]|uniref:RRM domain-containing protein n=1 Tax=Pseudomicrostroma glucosiphilum TaxID=1684307 RepID=A0A316UJD3_9BASI|nr:hypothetical protein BCV69DRAFT_310784 [Pseudomicrostroma glucosiphilum]PWN23315.1 hypothetical protein BCV69DRAFT_310784 [Pseudomicrostroma glucosiphilum]